MTIAHQTTRGTIHRAYAEDVYPEIEPGSVELVISDGPYGMRKAAWDRMKVGDLPEWYRPHVEAWGRVCAPSASVYLWGSSASWAAVHPVMLENGWVFRGLVVWDKGIGAIAGRCSTDILRMWPDVSEVCGLYQRGPNEMDLWNEWGEAHPVRRYLAAALERSGLTLRDVNERLGVSDVARHWFTWSQFHLPSEKRYEQLREILPGLDRPLADLRAEHRRCHDQYRDRLERERAPFTLPHGVTNVWPHPIVTGSERLRGPDGRALHPCQKPLAFYDRIIRASSRPGSLVLEPFAGTCRAAVACEALPDDEARRYVCIEPDADGRDYLPAVINAMR